MGKLNDDEIARVLKATPSIPGQAIQTNTVDINVSLDDVEAFGNKESISKMYQDISSYNKMLKQKITFINPALSAAIPFTRENLYLICAYTGNGKSTIAANISHPLWKEGKKTLVISNEEPQQDVMYRIACLELGYNFNDYKKGTMPMAHQKACALLFPEISSHVKVIDVNYKNGLSTKIEGVKNALEAVKNADYSAVMIDYFQLIQYSVGDPSRSRYNVLNDLRIWLGQYIRSSNIPVVMFAQLHSMAKRTNVELDSRIKECPGILEPSTVVLEVIPDFENQTTKFLIKKDRFGYQGMAIECGFSKGKYIEMSAEHILATQQDKVDELMDKVATSVSDQKTP